jgi:hypothetical protein
MDCDRTVHVTPWEGRNTLAGAVGLYKSFPLSPEWETV